MFKEKMMNDLTEKEKRFSISLVTLSFVLLFIVLFGFIYLATTPATPLTMLLSFTGGISNIVLPCTLPLVFIIVPLAMSAGNARKGLVMSVLFGAGGGGPPSLPTLPLPPPPTTTTTF